MSIIYAPPVRLHIDGLEPLVQELRDKHARTLRADLRRLRDAPITLIPDLYQRVRKTFVDRMRERWASRRT